MREKNLKRKKSLHDNLNEYIAIENVIPKSVLKVKEFLREKEV